MADTRVSNLDITRTFAEVFHSNCVFAKNMNAEYEKNFGSQVGFEGQKIGPTLSIRNPIKVKTRTGWAMSTPDVVEDVKTLTIDTPMGEDLKFTDADMHTTIDDFEKRYVEVPAKQLAADVDATCATYMLTHTPNLAAASSLAVPTSIDTYLAAASQIKEALVPMNSELKVAINPTMERAVINGLTNLYNPQAAISKQFLDGVMARAGGMEFYMSQLIPSITCGTSVVGANPVVGSFSTSANTTLPFSSGTSSGTFAAGQVISIAGLYEVNYETKTVYSRLKQFTIVSAYTTSGTTGSLTVFPAINFTTTDPKQNCYIAGGSINGAAITFAAENGSTAVPYNAAGGVTYQQALVWYDKAFAFASIPLAVPEYIKGAQVEMDNLNFRFLRGYDIINARYISRLDIFFGITEVRGTWASKIWTV
jgi:P22 coat protein - gene protein 5